MVTPSLIPQEMSARQSPFKEEGVGAARAADAFATALAEKRALIDGYDRQIISTLSARTKVVEQVAELKQQQHLSVFMKPGREASILRTMLAANAGQLPPRLIVQLWREIMMASLQLEQAFTVAAVVSAPGAMQCWELARDHFGCVTPLVAASGVAEALAEVAAGRALLAVLPDPVADWWPLLLASDVPLRFVFRLPFLGGALDAGAPGKAGGGWAVGPVPPEVSGDDWTLLVFKSQSDISQAQHDLDLSIVARWQHAAGTLVALQGAVLPDNPRLARLPILRHLGVVAVPMAESLC
jgi:chorismate mutase